nr:hypothetical protein [uncultured Anaerosporobacter sp.]
MKIKYVTEKEMKIKEDKNFRDAFIKALSETFAVTMPTNLPEPGTYEFEEGDEEFDEELYEENCVQHFACYEAVIKNLQTATTVVTEVSQNYYIIPAIPDIADDKLQFIVDLEERYYFFDIPALIADSGTTIIKKVKIKKIA